METTEVTEYIGDGVYATKDEYGIKLSTQRYVDGEFVTHWIYLDAHTLENLNIFVKANEQE